MYVLGTLDVFFYRAVTLKRLVPTNHLAQYPHWGMVLASGRDLAIGKLETDLGYFNLEVIHDGMYVLTVGKPGGMRIGEALFLQELIGEGIPTDEISFWVTTNQEIDPDLDPATSNVIEQVDDQIHRNATAYELPCDKYESRACGKPWYYGLGKWM